jgi:hypothetical protein
MISDSGKKALARIKRRERIWVMLCRVLVTVLLTATLSNESGTAISEINSSKFATCTYHQAGAAPIVTSQRDALCPLEDDTADLRASWLHSPSAAINIAPDCFAEVIQISQPFLRTQTLESQHVLLRI